MACKVSILVPDVSSNILGAATAMARHIAPDFDVEIIGPDLGQGVNAMYRGAFDYKVVFAPRIYRYPDFWAARKRIIVKQIKPKVNPSRTKRIGQIQRVRKAREK